VAEIEERARSAEGKMRHPYKESAKAKRQFIEPDQSDLPVQTEQELLVSQLGRVRTG
jgi:hypothetical protein